jgi:hypothetical protein
MTWTKTSDDFPDRLLDSSDAAYRLHHAATTYCNRVGLDGRLPRKRIGFVPVPRGTSRPAVIRELVTIGLWRDDGDAWTLVDFFEAQPSHEEVEAALKYGAIRQRIRYAKTAEKKAELRAEEAIAKQALFDARERRKALLSLVRSQKSGQVTSQRPARSRARPPRPHEGEGEPEERRNGKGSSIPDGLLSGNSAFKSAMKRGDFVTATAISREVADDATF